MTSIAESTTSTVKTVTCDDVVTAGNIAITDCTKAYNALKEKAFNCAQGRDNLRLMVAARQNELDETNKSLGAWYHNTAFLFIVGVLSGGLTVALVKK